VKTKPMQQHTPIPDLSYISDVILLAIAATTTDVIMSDDFVNYLHMTPSR